MTDQAERPSSHPLMQVGRYVLFDEIASGGFASIHLGRTVGVAGFARTVAIKRLHRQFAKDPEVSAMFLDEAKVVARIRHPNVLPTLDLIAEGDELFLVMEYVEGLTLRALMREARRRKRRVPLAVVLKVMVGALQGLHAAHEARTERGEPLQLIHRDVAPDNILVGTDGMPRLLDFGVARALGQFHATRSGEVKGKLAYITPEQVRGDPLSRRSDIFSASAVLWEAMTGRKLFRAKTIGAIAHAVLNQPIDPPSVIADTPKKLDGIVMQGLERDPERRWATAAKMAAALEAVGELASQSAVGRYVRTSGADKLEERAQQVAMVEAYPISSVKPTPARSSLQSLSDMDDDAILDEASIPDASRPGKPPPRGSALGADVTDLANIGDTPSATAIDGRAASHLDRAKLIPVAVGAFALGAVVVLAATLGGETPEAGEARSGGPAAPVETAGPHVGAAAEPARAAEPLEPSAQPSAQPAAQPAAEPSSEPVVEPPPPAPVPRSTQTWRPPPPPPQKKGGSLYGRE